MINKCKRTIKEFPSVINKVLLILYLWDPRLHEFDTPGVEGPSAHPFQTHLGVKDTIIYLLDWSWQLWRCLELWMTWWAEHSMYVCNPLCQYHWCPTGYCPVLFLPPALHHWPQLLHRVLTSSRVMRHSAGPRWVILSYGVSRQWGRTYWQITRGPIHPMGNNGHCRELTTGSNVIALHCMC